MYCLKTQADFDAAHFLKDYNGKCSNIHGHHWFIEIEIISDTIQEYGNYKGMVIDFNDIKRDLKTEIDKFDHTLIIEKNSLKDNTINALYNEGFKINIMPFRPTAENLACYFYNKMKSYNYDVKKVRVYETPNNCAEYWE